MRRTNQILWIIQWLLAGLFLFAGISKLAMPAADLAKVSPFPVAFLRFIGVVEALGAIGLVAPGLARIRTGLTPLAALGLTIVMIGAVVVSLPAAGAIVPLIVGALAAFVAYGRNRVAPLPR